VTGNIAHVRELEKRTRKQESQFIEHAAHGGHLYLIEKMYSQHYLIPDTLAYWLGAVHHFWFPIGSPSARFINKELALHSLSFISNPSFFNYIVNIFINKSNTMDYDIIEVAHKAKKYIVSWRLEGLIMKML